MTSTAETNCVFCKIVKGEIPSLKVFEDANFMAFLDIHPESTGHCQVIPKKHARWVWDVSNIGDYMKAVQKVALAQRKAFGTDWIVSKIIGDEVPHAHIWLVPKSHTKNGDVSKEEAQKLILSALR